jgi:hypothetical protein
MARTEKQSKKSSDKNNVDNDVDNDVDNVDNDDIVDSDKTSYKKDKKKHKKVIEEEPEEEPEEPKKDKKSKKDKKKHKKVKQDEDDAEEVEEPEEAEEAEEPEVDSEEEKPKKDKKSKRDKKHKKKPVESEEENDEDDEDNIDEEKIKIKMLKNLKYDFASYEIKYIYETYLKHEGEINLSPSYQREFAWNNDKQDLFIDSIMNNYIIPPIILIKLNDKRGFRYECMDGQHRLTVLKHYMESKPINPDDPHYIRFTKTEENKKVGIFYEKKKRLENIKDKRYMTENEMNTFNDKKIIIIKISNYDPKLTDLFGTIKNEMFLRLQKGERAGGTDIVRNCSHPLIEELKKRGLISYKTYDSYDNDEDNEEENDEDNDEDNDEENDDDDDKKEKVKNHFGKLKNIMQQKTKKVSQRLTNYLFFVLKGVLVAKLGTLEIGSLTEAKIREDILNSKTLRFTLKANQQWESYINQLNEFIGVINSHLDNPVSQYLLILLFYNYISNKEVFDKCLKNLDKINTKFTDEYFKVLFSTKEGGKVKKLFEGSRLNVAQTALKTLIV